jgi:hypothetical protein
VPQRLILMGSEALGPGTGYALGALKLLIDERNPPEITALAACIGKAAASSAPSPRIASPKQNSRCSSPRLSAGGAQPGDRIEHGGLIPEPFVSVIAAAGLTVVTNPAFIHDRGDRYSEAVASAQHGDLYRRAAGARGHRAARRFGCALRQCRSLAMRCARIAGQRAVCRWGRKSSSSHSLRCASIAAARLPPARLPT